MGRPLDLLLVEDSELDAELIVAELRRHGYDVDAERVDAEAPLRAALGSRSWDIVLCDHGLPGFASRAAQAIVTAAGADLPFVIMSGTIGEEAAVEALQGGARDVVLKTNLSRLGPVMDRVLDDADRRRRHHEAERELRESEARKTTILDASLDCVVSIDGDGRIIDFNPAAEAAFGLTAAEVLGHPMVDRLVPERLRQSHRDGFARYLAGGEGRIIGSRIELSGLRADGSEFPIELAITRSDLAGRPLFTAFIRDLTSVKEAEAERASLEARLRQAQKLEAIGSLAGGITHDFNNILAIVNGYSELTLRRLAPDDPLRGYIEQIHEAGQKAVALTRQLLAFSRHQILEARVVDLNAIVDGLAPMLRRVIGEDVSLKVRLDPGLRRMRADPSQLEQVLMNLAINARDAMPGGGLLEITTRNVAREPARVLLTVADTGVGMDAETRERIFDPFFTTKEMGKGTGLGLSTVYGIVAQSEGTVEVDSAPGRGTTFALVFPAVDAPLDEPGQADVPAPVPVETAQREVILLVEDDEGVLRLLEQTLGDDGYAVLAAGNGRRALELSDQHQGSIELVLTDVVMPGSSGLDLVGRLLERRPGIKLLLMSGYVEHSGNEDAFRALGAAFLQKPFDHSSLLQAIRELLGPPPG